MLQHLLERSPPQTRKGSAGVCLKIRRVLESVFLIGDLHNGCVSFVLSFSLFGIKSGNLSGTRLIDQLLSLVGEIR